MAYVVVTRRQAARYTARVMSRRILPLVMTLTIALCPVALDVCQVACAQHQHDVADTPVPAGHHHYAEPDDAMVAHHHADHAASAAGTASRIPAYTTGTASRIPACTVRGAPHGCLHVEDLPAFVGTNFQIALAPTAVIPMVFALAGLTFGPRLSVDTNSVVHSPPVRLTTQLRV